MWGGDSSGVWDGHVHTAVFKMDNQQRPTVQYKKLCSMFCGSLDGRADWGKMDTCICTAESLHCSPEIVTTLIINYTPNKKFERERKKSIKCIFTVGRTGENWGPGGVFCSLVSVPETLCAGPPL